jgi:hypothetical protein
MTAKSARVSAKNGRLFLLIGVIGHFRHLIHSINNAGHQTKDDAAQGYQRKTLLGFLQQHGLAFFKKGIDLMTNLSSLTQVFSSFLASKNDSAP